MFDAMRLELAPFNIKVSIVEPGFFTSKLQNKCFDASKYTQDRSVYSQASKQLAYMRNYQSTLWRVAAADDVAQTVVRKLCGRFGPPPRFTVGTQAWMFKLFGFLYKFVAPRIMHTGFLYWFDLNRKW